MWNLSRSENIEINKLEMAKDAAKDKMEIAVQLHKEIKKTNVPMMREDRAKVIKKWKSSKTDQ
jgi:hypothetical protein